MNQTSAAITQALKNKTTRKICVIATLVLFVAFIALPIFTVPGNTFWFQLQTFRQQDYLLMLALAALAGLNMALFWFAVHQKKNQSLTPSVAGSVTSGAVGIFAAIVGTASCASCLAAIFSLIGLGTGSVFFVLKNQSAFLLGSIALMVISLSVVSRKINKVCHSC